MKDGGVTAFLMTWDPGFPGLTWESDDALATLTKRLGARVSFGSPLQFVWTHQTFVRDPDEGDGPLGDFFLVDGGFLGMRARVPSAVRELLGKFGEILPCKVTELEEDCAIFNATNKRTIFFPDESTEWSGGLHRFIPESLEPWTVVRDTKYYHDLYCVEGPSGMGLRQICENHNLTGLHFQKVFPPPSV